ncbi:MAG TPA: hypothetical protein ENN06_10595 [Desulfobacteraceae bacterium]|nr:hypothetical protein [Desulfobacteraceae bacterium]
MKTVKQAISTAAVLFLSLMLAAAAGYGQPADMGGWEEIGEYNRLYTASELDRLKCTIDKVVEVEPMQGMAPGIALLVKDADGEKITVHVGPKWFLGDSIGFKRGDEVKIRGAWAEIEGREVFMAAKIKKGDFAELKVRLTRDGKPFWTMTPEELARERDSE